MRRSFHRGRRRGGRLLAGALALMLTGGVVSAGTPASAASVPAVAASQLEAQWWFAAWAIEEKVWPVSRGAGQVVAVIDTGVQADLPDLAGVVRPGKDYVASGDGRTDSDGHGTAMAILIASQGTGTGLVGVAPEAEIIPLAVGDDTRNQAPSVRDAVDMGATVISMSIGSENLPCTREMQLAVSYAIENDVVLVAAAGNEGDGLNFSNMPANCPGVFSIGAVDHQAVPAPYSQRQDYVDAAGPGTDIQTPDTSGQLREVLSYGTSNATALVSGAVALVRAARPELTNREVVDLLIATTRDIGAPGKDEHSGWGVVRPHMALHDEEVRGDTRNTVFETYDQWAADNPELVGGDDPLHAPPSPLPVAQDSEVDRDGLMLGIALVGGGGLLCLLVVVGGGILLFVLLRRNR